MYMLNRCTISVHYIHRYTKCSVDHPPAICVYTVCTVSTYLYTVVHAKPMDDILSAMHIYIFFYSSIFHL